ncbi:MAG: ATP-binding protein [Proteobacteria bacterium]|nr:ATP-binding protein [Cystobacterineae bacterium]MCL2259275.1 ATP-binding protein [Cystobacterineae bacterium]MCL2314335.1 ATP-binding protein [Pseudomonadota bacterium]
MSEQGDLEESSNRRRRALAHSIVANTLALMLIAGVLFFYKQWGVAWMMMGVLLGNMVFLRLFYRGHKARARVGFFMMSTATLLVSAILLGYESQAQMGLLGQIPLAFICSLPQEKRLRFWMLFSPMLLLVAYVAAAQLMFWQPSLGVDIRHNLSAVFYAAVAFDIFNRVWFLAKANQSSEERLAEALGSVRSANKAKSEFLANMSHEIRTPLNGMLGMAELVLRGRSLPPEHVEYLRAIISSGKALSHVISDILDVSRAEAGKMELEEAPFRVEEVVFDAAHMLATRAAEKSLAFFVEMAPEVPTYVLGDVSRFRQVFINLVGNAIKFTSEGEVDVRLAYEEGERLHLTVRDTGPGIPTDKQARMFEAFYQADTSSARQHSGTGLGLTIVKQLAALMGGDIWFKSSEGQGSTFHFVARMPKLGSEEEVACLATGTKVLVLCEHKRSREVLCKQIERMDVQIFDGSMEQLEQSHELLDVAFVDLDEAIDRLEVAQNLVATNKARACVLLAFPSPKVPMEEELKKAGILRILLKPVSPLDLKRFLMKAPDFKSSQTPIPVLTPSRRLRVLLVEDNEVNTVLMRRLLERLGHEVVHVGNGTRALEVLRDEKVDVVLMDVQMPEMDGFETTQRIRREEDGTEKHMPIVALTANAMVGDERRCFEAGMDAFLSKPVKFSKLESLLENVASGRFRSVFFSDVQP